MKPLEQMTREELMKRPEIESVQDVTIYLPDCRTVAAIIHKVDLNFSFLAFLPPPVAGARVRLKSSTEVNAWIPNNRNKAEINVRVVEYKESHARRYMTKA